MAVFKTQLNKLSQTHYGKYFLVLFLFLALSLVSLFVFYNGFLINFNLINNRVFGESVPGFLNHVPYHSFSILLSSLIHPYFLTGMILLYFPIVFFRKPFLSTEFTYQKSERILVFGAAFLLTWELVTYNYNYYLDSAFYFDRILLIILTFALLRFPLLTPLYIAFAFVYRSQFNYPVDGFDLFDKRILFDVLLMYVSLTYVKLFFKNIEIPFLYLVLCIIASNYFVSGVSKITMSPHGYEWLIKNDLSDLFLNVHARGWLCNYDDETISGISAFLSKYSVLFQSIILILELAVLFLFRNIKLCIALLILLCCMHFGIFLAGSMMFWKWMTIDLIVAVILWRNKKYFERNIFTRKQFLTSLLIIISSVIWLRPYPIGWFDTKANQYFTYEAIDETGKIAEVAKNELNPFHQWFQYDKFTFLVNKNCLPISGFGYTGRYQIKAQLDSISPENIVILKSEYGKNNYRADKAQEFETFIKTYFINRNKKGSTNFLFTYIKPPHHLNNCVKGGGLNSLGKIKTFRVIYNVSCNKNGKVVPLTKEIVSEISI